MPKFIKKSKLHVPLRHSQNFSALEKAPSFTSKTKLITELDPKTIQWVNSVLIVARYSPSWTTVNALDIFWKNLSSPLKSKLISIFPFPPDGVLAATIPFYIRDWQWSYSSHNVNFNETDLNKNGLKGNGANKFLFDVCPVSKFDNVIDYPQFGASILVSEKPTGNNHQFYFGVSNTSTRTDNAISYFYDEFGKDTWLMFGSQESCNNVIKTDSRIGFVSINFDGEVYKRWNHYINNQNTTIWSEGECITGTPPYRNNFYAFAQIDDYPITYEEENTNVQDIYGYSSARIGFLAFHDYLTEEESQELYSAVNLMRQNMGGDTF